MIEELKRRINFKIKSVDNTFEGVILLNKNNDIVFAYKRINDKIFTKEETVYLSDFLKNKSDWIIVEDNMG